jgi:hypothetical protein
LARGFSASSEVVVTLIRFRRPSDIGYNTIIDILNSRMINIVNPMLYHNVTFAELNCWMVKNS